MINKIKLLLIHNNKLKKQHKCMMINLNNNKNNNKNNI